MVLGIFFVRQSLADYVLAPVLVGNKIQPSLVDLCPIRLWLVVRLHGPPHGRSGRCRDGVLLVRIAPGHYFARVSLLFQWRTTVQGCPERHASEHYCNNRRIRNPAVSSAMSPRVDVRFPPTL